MIEHQWCAGDDGAVLYYVSDAPLFAYLHARAQPHQFEPVLFRRAAMLAAVERVSHAPGAEHRNRCGVLLQHIDTEKSTKTLTPGA